MDENKVERHDSLEVINAKFRTELYAGMSDAELRQALADAGVPMVDAFDVVDGQVVKVK